VVSENLAHFTYTYQLNHLMPTLAVKNCLRVAIPSAIRRFHLPPNSNFPSSSKPRRALVGRHRVSPRHQPRGHHWYFLMYAVFPVDEARSTRLLPASRRFVLCCFSSSLHSILTFSLPSVPLTCTCYLSQHPGSTHHGQVRTTTA
jgi:hypothetical protein